MDQPSTSNNDNDEPVRFTIPQPSMDEYLEYDPEYDSYFSRGVESTFDLQAWWRKYNKHREEFSREAPIPAEDLKVGKLLPPPERKSPRGRARRNSLGEERDLFSDLTGDGEKPDNK